MKLSICKEESTGDRAALEGKRTPNAYLREYDSLETRERQRGSLKATSSSRSLRRFARRSGIWLRSRSNLFSNSEPSQPVSSFSWRLWLHYLFLAVGNNLWVSFGGPVRGPRGAAGSPAELCCALRSCVDRRPNSLRTRLVCHPGGETSMWKSPLEVLR